MWPWSPTGHSLQRLSEDPSVQFRHVSVWRLLSERGSGGCRSLSPPQRSNRDQAPQQYVHVQSQPGHETHFPGLQVPSVHMLLHSSVLILNCRQEGPKAWDYQSKCFFFCSLQNFSYRLFYQHKKKNIGIWKFKVEHEYQNVFVISPFGIQ